MYRDTAMTSGANPYTGFLSQWSGDQDFARFVGQWDQLERLVIGITRGYIQTWNARPGFGDVQTQLRLSYPRWEPVLRPYWQGTLVGGVPTVIDPFRFLINLPGADSVLGNRQAMQMLPAAREAINRFLLEHSHPGTT